MLNKVVYRVEDPESLATWHQNVLGMETQKSADGWQCNYLEGNGCGILIKKGSGTPYQADRSSVYWKIGLSLQDVDEARSRILKHTTVSEGNQFKEIGYLCHLKDPAGFSLELLQHTFEKNFKKPQPNPSLPLGQPVHIGQITIRSSDIQKSLAFYEATLGMKLLSIQPVVEYGFTLYFLAFTEETPPSADLESVENREWLWQRPYTTLEIQHKPGAELIGLSREGQGVAGFEISNLPDIQTRLKRGGYTYTALQNASIEAMDPDGMYVFFTVQK